MLRSSQPLFAVVWMTVSVASFCLMAIAIRELHGQVNVAQLLLVRSMIGLLVIASIIYLSHQPMLFTTQKPGLHSLRNLFHFAGQYGWIIGIGALPLAEVFALEFTVPLWTIVIAAAVLGEQVTGRKLLSLAFGIAGVLVIVQPGRGVFDPVALIVLGAAICYAVSHTCTKHMALTEKPITVLFYMCLVQLPVAAFLSISDWQWPAAQHWLWLVIIGLTALTAHFGLAKAMHYAELGKVVTLDFLRLPVIALAGVWLYQEPLQLSLLLGGVLMLLANMINLRQKN